MYNEEIKKRFLQESDSKNQSGSKIFLLEQFAVYEDKFGKDIYQMSFDEIKDCVNSVEFLESGTLGNAIALIKSYAKWCAQNNIFDGCPGGIFAIMPKDVDPAIAISKIVFKDEDSLSTAISKVRTFSDGYPEVMATVLLWSGLTMPQVFRLRDEHINLETGVVLNEDGSEIIAELSPWALLKAQVYAGTKSGFRDSGNGPYEVVCDKSFDSFIKRFCTTNSKSYGMRLTYNQIVAGITRMRIAYEDLGYTQQFSSTNIRRSGALYRLWKLEQSGVNLEAPENRTLVESTYGAKKYYGIIWQYKNYKRAFNL